MTTTQIRSNQISQQTIITGLPYPTFDDQCSWCSTQARHAHSEHISSIATFQRVVRGSH